MGHGSLPAIRLAPATVWPLAFHRGPSSPALAVCVSCLSPHPPSLPAAALRWGQNNHGGASRPRSWRRPPKPARPERLTPEWYPPYTRDLDHLLRHAPPPKE